MFSNGQYFFMLLVFVNLYSVVYILINKVFFLFLFLIQLVCKVNKVLIRIPLSPPQKSGSITETVSSGFIGDHFAMFFTYS